MADNVAITAGTGTSIATDDIGGAQFQRMKVALGPDGTHTADLAGRVVTGSDGALYVDPRPKLVRVTATPVISSGSIYANGDCLGPLQTIANAVRAGALSGRILSATIVDKTQAQRAAIDILFFTSTVTTAADNAAFTISDTDIQNCLGVIPVKALDYNTAWPGTPLNSIATVPYADLTTSANLNNSSQLPFPIVTTGTDLFMQLIVRGTPTYTSTSDIVVSLIIEQF
jgi:hypothetical protein